LKIEDISEHALKDETVPTEPSVFIT
jgi:hypothetical protein